MSLWARAQMAAAETPANRNRTADFIRAAAILIVVTGHWLVSVPQLVDGEFRFTELLVYQPWVQYLTWVVQVMPIFFFVGGFSNAASWSSAAADPVKRAAWQSSRLKRLLLPIAPLVVVWAGFAAIAGVMGLNEDLIRNSTRAALIPVWFLAVYILVTVVVPLSYKAWELFGLWSVVALVAGAISVDAIAFGADLGWLRWVNYAFIWMSMHQLGYWWHGGARGNAMPLLLVAAGLGTLYLLVAKFGYPVSMISVPGEEFSNSRPPTMAMLAIGFTQAGAILLVAGRVAARLQEVKSWALVILISQRIMTVYLWHLTALLAVVGLAMLAGGFGLGEQPGTGLWWLTRPLWFALMILVLLPLVAAFGWLEDGSRQSLRAPPGPVRSVIGAVSACAGLTFMALDGTFGENALGVNLLPVGLTLAGIALATISARNRGAAE